MECLCFQNLNKGNNFYLNKLKMDKQMLIFKSKKFESNVVFFKGH